MNDIYEAIKDATDEELKMLEEEIRNGDFTNERDDEFIDVTEIDYLFHEYVYILDFEKKKWQGFKTKKDGRRTNRRIANAIKYGKLIPLIEDLDFKDHIHFYRNEENFECVTKVVSMEDKINYKIIFDGKLVLHNSHLEER